MESDTPRTDANNANCLVGHYYVDADFARQLERELAAAIKQRDEAREELCRVVGYQRQDRFDPKAIASERGWDCFAKKQGGGA